MGNTDLILSKIEQSFNEYLAFIFERVCRDLIMEKADFPVLLCGRHWDKDMEIDIVAVGDDMIIFGECKWSNNKIGIKMLKELQAKVAQLDPEIVGRRSPQFALFSKTGFKQDLITVAQKNNIGLYSIDDFAQ
jgi:AAA+ ATPase superfamily predicted ATPase